MTGLLLSAVSMTAGVCCLALAIALARLAWAVAFWPEWKLRELAGLTNDRDGRSTPGGAE